MSVNGPEQPQLGPPRSPVDPAALYKLSSEGLFLACLSCAEGVLVSSWVIAVPHLVMEPPGWDLNPPPWVDFLAWPWLSLVSVGLPAGCGTWSEGLTSPLLWCCLMIWTLLGPSLCLSLLKCCGVGCGIPLASNSPSLRQKPCSCCSLAGRILSSSCWDLPYLWGCPFLFFPRHGAERWRKA